jgi:HTH-type transcriptional regulator/antitoxin HipB
MNSNDKKLVAEIKELKNNGDKIYERQAAERTAYFKDPANAGNLRKAKLSLSLAKMMHDARVAGGFTQHELAAKLHTRQSYIAEVEKGKRNITIETLERYAAACGRRVEFKMV